jgi:hypothetical protein
MKKQIIQLLQCTEHQYEMLIFMHFQYWCELHATETTDLQNLLANQSLEQWFQTEYQKLQLNFLQLAKPYKGRCSKQDMERMYKVETIHIQHIYPKPLLKAARSKSNVILGNPLAN